MGWTAPSGRLTARECLWNTDGGVSLAWGSSVTLLY